MNLHIKTGLGIKNYVLDPNSNVEYEFFWLNFRGNFEQKTQNLIFLQNQWKLKNIKKAIVVKKNYLLIDAFYKINFWPILKKLSQKNDFFFIFHFLKFLPICVLKKDRKWGLSRPLVWKLKLVLSPTANYSMSRAYSLVDFHDYCTTSAHKRSFGHTWSADRLFWFWKLH